MKVKPPSSTGTTQKKIPPSSAMAGKSRYTRLTEKRSLRDIIPNLGGVLLGVALGLGGGALISSAYFAYEKEHLRAHLLAECESRERTELLTCLQHRGEMETERDNALARATVCELDLAHYKPPGMSTNPRAPDARFKGVPPVTEGRPVQESEEAESQAKNKPSPSVMGTNTAPSTNERDADARSESAPPLPPSPPENRAGRAAAASEIPPLPPQRPVVSGGSSSTNASADETRTTPKFDSLETLVSAHASQFPPRPPALPQALREARTQAVASRTTAGTAATASASAPSAVTTVSATPGSASAASATNVLRADSFSLKVGEERKVWEGLSIRLVAVSRRNSGKFCVLGGTDFNGARIPSGRSLVLQRGSGTPLHFSASVTGTDKCQIEVEERQ